MPGGAGKPLEEGGPDVERLELRGQEVLAVNGRKDRCLGEEPVEGPDDALGSAEGGKPFVDQCNLHAWFLSVEGRGFISRGRQPPNDRRQGSHPPCAAS
ncbi:hypothetical protein D3C78_1790720 [compost metagenome]